MVIPYGYQSALIVFMKIINWNWKPIEQALSEMFRSNLLNSNGNKYHVLVSANEKLNVNVGQLKIGINDREKRITLGAS